MGWSPALSLGPLGLLGQLGRGEARMGNAEGSKNNIVANASRWAPPGRELGDPGEERGGEEREPQIATCQVVRGKDGGRSQ